MWRAVQLAVLAAGLWGMLALPARAQPFERPQDERPELPAYSEGATPASVLPPIPPATPAASETGRPVFVRAIRVEGSSVLGSDELAPLLARFEGRLLRPDELVALRRSITQLYVARGYATSGATIPEQTLSGGVLLVRVIEGKLESIDIRGSHFLADDYLRNRLEYAGRTPLDVRRLQTTLQRFQRDPRVERLQAHLAPGDRPGSAVLTVDLVEADPHRLSAIIDNHNPPSLGAVAGELRLTHRSLTGLADVWDTRLVIGEGIRRIRSSYQRPVNRWDTELGVDGSFSSSEVVDGLEDLEIEAEAFSLQLQLRHPAWRGDRAELWLSLEAALRQSQTSLLGADTTFAQGAEDGRARVSVLRAVQELTHRTRNQVWAARSVVSAGFDVLGATLGRAEDPDAQFLAWLLQAQWARRWPWRDTQTLLRADLQLSSDPLLSLERFAIGGARSVRGFRENAVVRDQGIAASLELRVPVWSRSRSDWHVSVGPFADYGYAWNRARPTPGQRALASIGGALRIDWRDRVRAIVEWGAALVDIEPAGDRDIQDDGLHFRVEWVAF